jgi:putative ABC transport system permease protein
MDFRDYVRKHLPPLDVPREREIAEELAEHLECIYREGLDSGLDPSAARDRAVAALPAAADELAATLRTTSTPVLDRAAVRVHAALDEPAPSTGGFVMLNGFRRDFRYAMRALLRDRGLTAAVVITLAVAIGPVSAIFNGIDAVLLRQVSIPQPDRAVSVYTVWAARATTNAAGGDALETSSYPDYADLRDSGILKGLAAFSNVGLALDSGGVTERIEAAIVTGNYFDVLGVRPILGRAFRPEEDRIGAPVRVVVVSYRMWQQRLGADSGIVGRVIVLNGNPYSVIGVTPRGFGGLVPGDTPEAWVPMALQAEVRPPSAGSLRRQLGSAHMLDARKVRWLNLVGRLDDRSSLAETSAALDVIGRGIAAAHPESNRDLSATAVPLGSGPGTRARARPLLGLLAAAVILVLMIACANVASLLLARAVSRRREVAVRMAIGAGGGQLVRQWLTEAVILGVLGSAGGLILGTLVTPILYQLGIPEGVDLTMNPRLLAFTLLLGTVTGAVFGLAPILQLIRGDTLRGLRDEGGAVASGVRASRLRSIFVVVQVGLSLVLLVGAGLFIRTLQQAYSVDLGYSVDRTLLAEISPGERYSPEARQALYTQLLDRLNALPGVAAASAARVVVLSGSSRTVPVSLHGQPPRADRSSLIPVRANVISERYLETMGIPLIRGRNFQRTDTRGSTRVAIVSRSLAERLWGQADPVGQSFFSGSPIQVVGVVPDTIYVSPTERDPRPFFYLPLAQN